MKRKTPPPVPIVWDTPDGPDIASLVRGHNNADGGHVLFTNDPEKLRPMAAIPAGLLASVLPELLPNFDADSYYTLSQFKTPQPGKIPPGYASVLNVSHLGMAWVDIDGREAPGGAVEQWQIVSDVWRMAERGGVPWPSCWVDSGRGVWLIWQINPVELATAAAVNLLTRINKRAVQLFAPLGADTKSTNINRWSRVPGSINTKAGKRCAYLFAASSDGRPITYTLAELAEAFGVADQPATAAVFASLPALRPAPQPAPLADHGREKNPARVLGGIRGAPARARNTAAALLHLAALRGGFKKGSREMACHYLAVHLLRAGHSLPDVQRILSEPGLFSPPLSARVIKKHVDAAPRFKKTIATADGWKPLGQQEIADTLLITPNEVQAIGENIGIGFRYIYQNQTEPPAVKRTKAERIAARRARVAAIVAAEPLLTDRQIAARLTDEGEQVCHQTVQLDLRALQIDRPRRRRPRQEPPPDLGL